MGKLQNYTIMPLDTDHLEEVCADIRRQVETGVAGCALFSMTLVPEGTPPVDKVGQLCAKYDLFREKLSAQGIPSGVLVQATIGHGWVLSELFPYQQLINFNDGKPNYVVCPYDEGFREYIYHVMATITAHRPDCIMVDDDFRLMFREGNGCGCPLHVAAFNRLAGTKYDRQQIRDSVCNGTPEGERHKALFLETQREAVVDAAKVMRAGIDSVDPAMPGLFCCVGSNAEFADEIAAVLAGEGNPVVVRINNGNYTPAGARFFSNVFMRAATQIAKLEDKVDVILAETDTCPQNRYSTGAMSLHTHFTGTILEGAAGAKHWITRLSAYEPQSGEAYRRVLGTHSGFYQTLADLVPSLRWRGCRIPVSAKRNYTFGNGYDVGADGVSAWSMCVLERLGLPQYFSARPGGAVCLDGDADTVMTDAEILEVLHGPVLLASDTAEHLIERGFGEYLGVAVRDWQGDAPTGERLFVNGNAVKVQMQTKELVPLSDAVEADSVVYHSADKIHCTDLFPGTAVYHNSLGGTVFTFCGTPKAQFNIVEAFSFLNYSRKQQLIRMLQRTGELPVYFPGDEEMYLRAADLPDGGLLCAAFNIGLDPIDRLQLVTEKPVVRAEKLLPDGTRGAVTFSEENGVLTLETACNTLDPVILFLYDF